LNPQDEKKKTTFKIFKYVHHHTQIKELLEILKDTPIDYKKYPKYKGTESILERLGREYVSILRQEYSDKPIS
jgi:antibiotic biosynthesis monooxygenase (ABM) superfamily enzyme